MFLSRLAPVALVLCLLFSGCSQDPEVVKKRYLESGNKYYSKALYKEAGIMYRKALSKDKRYGEAYYRWGLVQLKLSDYTGAVRSFQRAIELTPDNQDAYSKLIDIYLTAYSIDPKHPKQHLQQVAELSSQLLKRNPKNWDGLRVQGYLALSENTKEGIEKAVKYFEQADQIKPRQADVSVALTQCYFALGDPAKSEAYGLETIRQHKDYQPMYDVLFLQYMKSNEPAKAEAMLKRKVADNPTFPAPYLQLANHYFRSKRPAEMQQELQTLLDRKDIPDARMNVGEFYLYQTGDADKAAEEFRKGAELSKKRRPEYEKKLAEALVNEKKEDEAAKVIDVLIRENSKDYEAIAMRASLNLISGKKERLQSAIDDLTQVAEKLPNEPIVRMNLGRALVAKGELDQAKAAFQNAIKIRPNYLPAHLALCQLYQRKREWGNAMQAADDTLAVDPNFIQAKLIRTDAMLNIGQFKQVRGELEDLLRLNPRLRDAKFQLALLDMREGRVKEAEPLLLDVEKMGDLRASLALADIFLAQNQVDKAVDFLQGRYKEHPQVLELKVATARTLVAARRYDQSIKMYDELMAAAPNNPELTIQLSELYRRMGDMGKAEIYGKKAAELLPNDIAPLVNLAQIYEVTNNRAASKAIYERIIRVQGTNAIALNNLAYMMAEQDDPSQIDQALTYAQRAKQSLPENLDISDTIAYIYTRKKLNDVAIGQLKDLLTKRPNNPVYHYHLALALSQKGDKSAAKKELDAALRNNPNADDEKRVQALMKQLP